MNRNQCYGVQGFTLIEVLVAALVLGVGLLGLVSLQAKALQYNQQAYLYSQASFLVSDIVERMRVNSSVVDQYTIDFNDPGAGVSTDLCVAGNCTAAQLADWDVTVWKTSLEDSLPDGDGAIVRQGDQYLITVQFDDSRGGETPWELTVAVQI